MTINSRLQNLILRFVPILASIVFGLVVREIAVNLRITITDLIALLLSITIIAISLVVDDNMRATRAAIQKIGTTYYLEDRGTEADKKKLYGTLGELLRNAKEEVLAVAPVSITTFKDTPNDSPSRKHYYRSVQDNVIGRITRHESFRYVRLFQVEDINAPIWETHGDTVAEHCRKILQMRGDKSANDGWNIAFKKLPKTKGHGFLVIDKRILIIIIDGFDKEMRPYHAGYLVIEGGDIVKEFVRRFEDMENHDEIRNVGLNEFRDFQSPNDAPSEIKSRNIEVLRGAPDADAGFNGIDDQPISSTSHTKN